MKTIPIKNLYHINGQVLCALNEKEELVCVAKGCHSIDVTSTLIGLRFCEEHFGDFFSDNPLEYENPRDATNAHEWTFDEIITPHDD